MTAYRRATELLAALTAALGLVILVVAAVRGGGSAGFLIGALFVAAGVGRLYLLRRRR